MEPGESDTDWCKNNHRHGDDTCAASRVDSQPLDTRVDFVAVEAAIW